MQKARWHDPVCFCLFFSILGDFLLTLYFTFIFSLDSKPQIWGARRGRRVQWGGAPALPCLPQMLSPWHQVFFVQKRQLFSEASGNRRKDSPWESAFSEAPKNVPPPALASSLDIYFFFKVISFLSYKDLHSFLFVFRKFHGLSASHVGGLPFESKLFVERHYLSGNSSVKTWRSRCCSRDHLSPLEDKTCHCLPSYDFLWEDRWLRAW